MKNEQLIKGTKYTTSTLTCVGWTEGDGSGHEGYNVSDYFTSDGAYLGADQHGIEPLFHQGMTEAEATEWVRSHSDDDQLDEQQLEAAFRAIFAREPDDEDREQGLWSHLCAAVE